MHGERSRLYTEEVNAAVRGAFTGGATEVVVMDCHGAGQGWTFNSLIPDQLDLRCDFVVQQEWNRHQRSALRNLGLPGADGDGRPRRLPGGEQTASAAG